MLEVSWIGRQFKHYSNKRIYTIMDIYTTTNLSGKVVNQTYVTENEIMGQEVMGECPKSTIDRSVLINGWV